MTSADSLRSNLVSPIVLECALGDVARLVRAELCIPRAVLASLSIYRLLASGLKGGRERAHVGLVGSAGPAAGNGFGRPA